MSRHVFETMGTVVSLAADGAIGLRTVAEIEAVFDDYNRRFSLFRDDSELSRIAAGTRSLLHASPAVLDAYERSLDWRNRTHGVFTPHRPDGVIDLSGIVKALAIEDAGSRLDCSQLRSWSINCGGDVLIRRAEEDNESVVGIVDPDRRESLLAAITIPRHRRAIATSGTAERGDHVWGARADYTQVTVIAADIVTADVVATAVLAGGRELCDEAAADFDCDVLAVSHDGDVVATRGIRLASPSQ